MKKIAQSQIDFLFHSHIHYSHQQWVHTYHTKVIHFDILNIVLLFENTFQT